MSESPRENPVTPLNALARENEELRVELTRLRRVEEAARAMTYDPGVPPDSPYLEDLRNALEPNVATSSPEEDA